MVVNNVWKHLEHATESNCTKKNAVTSGIDIKMCVLIRHTFFKSFDEAMPYQTQMSLILWYSFQL